ncbi:MAG: divergent polysaccharide deacetylase family protein [Candidatus Omnitrophica bacterium]|nr:divergent polysaccharide deacetylase family protein [Candidatus Omnitrophota bacterium]MCM8802772.1 divergent polysaccharide deacetylase family protein [Candidatus Omnitrophota bacterium]
MIKKENNFSFFVPLVLFLILCILIAGAKLLQKLTEEKKIEEKPLAKLYPPEAKLYPPEITPEIPKKVEKKRIKGKVAIIIDDVGWNLSIIKELEKINQPLTLSILPKAPYSKKILNELKDKNYQFILHLPLEPKPPSQCLDKGLITTNMDEEEIKKIFEDNVNDFLPYIKGINNHMGSLYTINEEKMRILLENIKEKNLFFVDSLTSSKSCGYRIAKELGIKTGKRDIFLDISPDPKEINKKIDEVIEKAIEKGSVIAIGHSKTSTLNILKNRLSDFEENGIKIVPVESLLE